jgi:hypothetical protein
LKGSKGAKGNHAKPIAALAAQMNQVIRELQVQLTRIAQLQAQLDHLSREESPQPAETKETE